MRYLDPALLARLKNLRLDLRKHLVEGHLAGRHRSAQRGFSQEFAQHRVYVPGLEIKRLDWKVYARRDRFFIKEFEEEGSLKTCLLVDASGSMGFRGSGPQPKWELACRLAMSLAYLVLAQGDAAGLMTFDTQPRAVLAPKQNFSHLELMDQTLESVRAGGETDLSSVLRAVAGRITRGSLIILISDLLGDARRILETVRAFHARKHRIFILQTLDPMERDLDLDGPVFLEGMEDRSVLRCEAGLLREAYRDLFNRQQRLYAASFRGWGLLYEAFYTDEAWEKSLARFIARLG